MRILRVIAAATLATLSLAPAASAGPPSRLDALRSAIGSPRLADAVRAAGPWARVPEPVAPVRPVPGIPSSIAGPVEDLRSAIASAEALRDRAVGDLPARLAARGASLVDRLAPKAVRARLDGEAPEALDVDVAALHSAAIVLAEAVDRATPALAAAAASVPAVPGAGCDVLDLQPALCVAGPGDNTISGDYALVLDLGGDDVHAHSAGAADVLGNGLPVALTLDVGGNDTYTSTIITPSGARVAQGAGVLGVGMLVDAAGDDIYETLATRPGFTSVGQGIAIAGAGVLADLGGDDAYRIAATGEGPVAAVGQSVADVGVTLALDRGGDDTYEVVSAPEAAFNGSGDWDPGLSAALAFGVAWNDIVYAHVVGSLAVATRAAAVFADDGGSDRIEARSIAGAPPPDQVSAIAEGASLTVAHGVSVGSWSEAFALGGDGPTEWIAESRLEAPGGRSDVYGIGMAVGGSATLSDAGGDDRYELTSVNRAARTIAVTDACGCEPPPLTMGTDEVRVWGIGATTATRATFVDASGDDRYLVTARNEASASIVDEREVPGDGHRATAIAQLVDVGVMGAAWGFGRASLTDEGGDDVYDVDATSTASAEVLPAGAGEASSLSGDATVMAQAAAAEFAHAWLHDDGGADRYEATAASAADVSADAVVIGQAAVENASALLVDRGSGADLFVMVPARPACDGTRGEGTWTDCGDYAGIGSND